MQLLICSNLCIGSAKFVRKTTTLYDKTTKLTRGPTEADESPVYKRYKQKVIEHFQLKYLIITIK